MTRILLALLLACAAAPAAAQQPAPAPSAAHLQAAEDLLAAMDAENTLRQTTSRMLESQVRNNPEMAPMQDVMRDFFDRHLTWDRVKPGMLALYTDMFSETEIRELTAFYRTPVGRKLVRQTPEIAMRSAEISERIVQDHLPELMQQVMARMGDPKAMEQAVEEAKAPPKAPAGKP